MRNNVFLYILILLYAPCATGQNSLETDSARLLNEVVVKGHLPQVKKDGTVSTIRVKGTVLSKMGNASAMLSNTPGLHMGASGIEVNGLGKPVFILNGKEIDPDKVLDLLQANTIKEIKIDKAPGLSYSTDGRPTVAIILSRPADDFMALSVGDDMAIRRKFSNVGTFNFGINLNKVSTTLDYIGGVTRFRNEETYFREIFRPRHTSVFNQKRSDSHRDLPQRVRWALDYDVDRHSRLGMEYYYQFIKKSALEEGFDVYCNGESSEKTGFLRQKRGISNLHNLSLQYSYKEGVKTFQVIQDIGSTSVNNNVSTTDGANQTVTLTSSGNKYHIYTTNIKFSTVIPLKINLLAGIKYTYISNTSQSTLDFMGQRREGRCLSTNIKEHDPQIFVSLSKKVGNLSINAGGRYRHMFRRIKNSDMKATGTTISRDISSFSPLLSLTYRNSRGTSLYVRLNRTVGHPGFNSLNSGYVYMDSLTYVTGNPELLSYFTNIVSAGVNWRDFSFSAKYTNTSNPIVRISEPLDENSDIIVEKDINLRYDNTLRISVEYSKTISGLNLYAEGSAVFPHGKYRFMGKEHSANRISLNGNLNINYRINSWLGAYLSFYCQGFRQSLTLTQKAVSNLTAGFTASLLKDRITVNLTFSDIFNRAHYNNVSYQYGNVSNGTYGTNDQRGVLIRINYAILSKKIKTRTKRSNDEETMRFY